MKTCTKCQTDKDFNCFHKAKRQKDGYNLWCKDCCKIYNAAYKVSPKGAASIEASNIKRAKTVKGISVRFSQAKYKAKTRGITWNLTLDEFQELINRSCHYCDNKLGKPVEYVGGLDRVDNNIKEYSVSNCVTCCQVCNSIKQKLSYEFAKLKIHNLINYPSMKTCTKCHELKDFECFSKTTWIKDGYDHYCKDCESLIYYAKKTASAGK